MKILGNSTGITQELIDVLQGLFPNELPVQHLDSCELARLQGQQDVIRKLIALYKEQIGDDT